jgi:hypothetical protein
MVQFLRLEQNVQQWCEAVKAAIAKEVPDREAILNKLTERGFHASKNMGEWLRLYGVPTEAGL